MERKTAVQAREATERYRSLLDNIPGAAFRCAARNASQLNFISDGVQALTGRSAAELLAGPLRWKDLVLPEDLPKLRRAAAKAVRTDAPYEIEYRIRHADGGIRWLHEKGRAIYGKGGEAEWLDGVIIDVTNRIEFESALRQDQLRQRLCQEAARLEKRVAQRTAELERMKDQAEASSRAKSRFLAQMSHALRTPLNSLLILAELLIENAQGNLTAKQSEFARVIHDAGGDLRGLINDILDIAKIETGRGALYHRQVSFLEVQGFVDSLFRRTAEHKGLCFDVDIGAELPGGLITDFDHLKPILRNLVANAIKFTPAGSVTLRVHLEDRRRTSQHGGPRVAFDVVDTGIGIAADQLPNLFDAFAPAASGTTLGYGGTGLGLHVARVNAELLAGELAAQSTPGQGSTFTLYLPLEGAPAGL